MNITLVDSGNFSRSSLDDFSRYQTVKNVYRLKDGELCLVYHPFTETWTPERKDEKAREILAGRHIVYGAFEGERIVGILMLLPEPDHGRLVIDSHGIGRALMAAAKGKAISAGASALYVSACSAQETIDFYRAMGFAVSPQPIRSYAEAEPCDIQMECRL